MEPATNKLSIDTIKKLCFELEQALDSDSPILRTHVRLLISLVQEQILSNQKND